MGKISDLLKIIGPGIIAASTAIGTSHLIQSTRAGGYFGFELLWIVILINILKYPFIEYGFRYTAGTGENMLHGYKKLSPKLLLTFLVINVVTSIGAISVLSYVCASIIKSVIGTTIDVKYITLGVLIICYLIIFIGHYKYLDNIMKFFMSLLLVSTFTALLLVISNHDPSSSQVFYTESAWSFKYIPFIIALMGWMPGPIELSVWHSLWLDARNKGAAKNLNFKQAAIDFNIGYLLMIITAIFFLSLGGLVLHNSGQELSSNGSVFASQFISVYVQSIGDWSKIIVSVAVVATILSSTLAVVDIYPRSLSEGFMILRGRKEEENLAFSRKLRSIVMFFNCLIAFIVVYFFVTSFKTLIDIVTITAFFSAPLFAYMNYKLVHSKLLDKKYHPPKWLKTLSQIGFIYIIAFCAIFLISILIK